MYTPKCTINSPVFTFNKTKFTLLVIHFGGIKGESKHKDVFTEPISHRMAV